MPTPEYFRVEEFVNYHRHDIGLPSQGKRVNLDLKQVSVEDGKYVVQIGIATPRSIDPETMPPLNIVLVIDRSGSMKGARIDNVKKSIRSFIERIRPFDKVSIVAFNTKAHLVLEACQKTEYQKISKAVDGIFASQSTNLHGGLMLGYQTAMNHFDKERTNRVVLLTDGIANVGTTNSKEIARQSKKFNDKGISLSTIGVGNDFNHQLLRELADAGKGLIHFVNDAKDIEKTFVREIDALLSPAVNDVSLEVKFRDNCEVRLFGYDGATTYKNRFHFELDDLNHGATQVVLFEVTGKLPTVTAVLTGKDAVDGKKIKVKTNNQEVADSVKQYSVKRNYGIGLVGQAMKDASAASNKNDCQAAERVLKRGIEAAMDQVDVEVDQHLNRVLKIARNYRTKILDCIERFGD